LRLAFEKYCANAKRKQIFADTGMTSLLECIGISKAFPGVQALADVNLKLKAGEILAVVGENGAGKSTLMNILGGVVIADTGRILLEGQAVPIKSVPQAERHGIVLIHQELNLADHLDVAGNVFLGREPTWGGPLRLISNRIYPDAEKITRRLGLDCSPRTLVSNLPLGQQQLVEIARALSLKSRILILDEPTSSLTEREAARLFQVMRDLKQTGIGVIYISHRIKEVEEIADRVSVLRDGRNAGELAGDAIRHDAIVRLMVGRELKQFFHRERPSSSLTDTAGINPPAHRIPALECRNLRWSAKQTQAISFSLFPGEIVGLAGLIGAGRTELAQTIFGIRPRLQGEVLVDGRQVQIKHPSDALAAGICLVPEDRRRQGLVLPASVRNNISLASLDQVSRLRLVVPHRDRDLARTMCRQLNIRTPGIGQIVSLLSGGNQQKVVLAKWLSRTPRVLILDEPTRGIDVGAKSEIYALMDQLAHQGLSLLMISSDLEEILGMSDRVLVMHQGRLAGEIARPNLTEEAIMHLATGGESP
jgi:ribose transport system ATP-binding protein